MNQQKPSKFDRGVQRIMNMQNQDYFSQYNHFISTKGLNLDIISKFLDYKKSLKTKHTNNDNYQQFYEEAIHNSQKDSQKKIPNPLKNSYIKSLQKLKSSTQMQMNISLSNNNSKQ